MERVPEPAEGSEREVVLAWLAFHRNALEAKCAGLTGEQLVRAAAPPSNLTLLGLIRHMTEMERVYLVYALGEPGELEFVYGPYEDGGPERDFDDLDPNRFQESLDRWRAEQQAADALLAQFPFLDAIGTGNGYSVRWNLLKIVGEYARHNGHADLIREALDGTRGE